jgi:hypothetical protein
MDDKENEIDFNLLSEEIAKNTLRSLLEDAYQKEITKKKLEHIIVGIDPNSMQAVETFYLLDRDHQANMKKLQPKEPTKPFTWKHPWEKNKEK